eukprot:scaffold182160_cov24-Tisochrysis_lutea.AAC.3
MGLHVKGVCLARIWSTGDRWRGPVALLRSGVCWMDGAACEERMLGADHAAPPLVCSLARLQWLGFRSANIAKWLLRDKEQLMAAHTSHMRDLARFDTCAP